MKRVVSVSLGSSKRDHNVETEILGQKFAIERRGTDGDMGKAIAMIKELDGQVDAFGLGGTDLYVYAGNRRYVLRDAKRIVEAAKITPVVDGSGLKNTLERRVVSYLAEQQGIQFKDKKVLVVSAVDRFGMAEALVDTGAAVVFGDLIFVLGLPIPIRSLATIGVIARLLMPVVSQVPFAWLYPTGERQEIILSKHEKYYQEADIIAGDFHLIRRYLPDVLKGKTILTNTVTPADIDLLRQRGIATLVTTTPELNGRSFGTNVMEGVLVSLMGKKPEQIAVDEYIQLLDQMGWQPRIEKLN
ncbi:MAG: quinate 5-dehydrogenase [Syntrophomonadaceae bacterium]|nr:quinate 5-dehydrogenase [Syntrophomonadaceae bacterium]